MENGFSLIPSQDSLFRLEPVMVTKKEKKKNLAKLRTSKVVSSSGTKKGCKSAVLYAVCDNTI